jgi:hypothetical protein
MFIELMIRFIFSQSSGVSPLDCASGKNNLRTIKIRLLRSLTE